MVPIEPSESELEGSQGRFPLRLSTASEDFQVEEVPAYAPCGQGEHLYVEIEKCDLTTEMVVSALARIAGCPRRAVGFAGRKDRRARTRQWFSLQGVAALDEAALRAATRDQAVLLRSSRHRNKLRLGHLRGNLFRLRLEADEPAGARAALERALRTLAEEGIPNRFGAQRFGRLGSTLRTALALGRGELAEAVRWLVDPSGDWKPGTSLPQGRRRGLEGRVLGALERAPDDPGAALRAAGRDFHRLAASAAQSAVFNAVLDRRRARIGLHAIRVGDVVQKLGAGAFVCGEGDLADVRARAAPGRLELAATGPLPGTRGFGPSEDVAVEERRWSEDTGVEWRWLERGGRLESPGERRPLIARFLEPPSVGDAGADCLELRFGLPSGSYATELLHELGVALPTERGASPRFGMLPA